MKKIILPLILVLVLSGVHAADTTLAARMDKMLIHLIKLGTFFDNNERLYNQSNRPEMIAEAKALQTEFKKATHHKMLQSNSLLPSSEILSEDLATLVSALEDKNMTYAKLQFGALRSICLSCHTQIDWKPSAEVSEIVASTGSQKLALSGSDKGDVYAIIRDYAKSSQYYQAELQNRAQSLNASQELNLLRKILHNFLTGMVDVSSAQAFFGVNLNSFKLTEMSKQTAREWMDELNVWNKKFPRFKDVSLSEFFSFFKERDQEISDSTYGAREVISYLMLGKAGKAIMNEDSGHSKAELLYYLGVSDEVVHSNFLFSLSELYFKQCIKEFPHSHFARKCFEKYEESIYSGFSGSGGVFIPKDVRAELESLRALIAPVRK